MTLERTMDSQNKDKSGLKNYIPKFSNQRKDFAQDNSIRGISLKDSIINVFPCATFEVPMDFKSMSSYRTSTLNVRSEQFFIFVSGFYFRETHWKWPPRLWISFPDIHRSMKSYSTWFPFVDIKIRFKLGVQSALKLLIWNSINPLKPKISLIYCPKPHFLGFPSRTVCTYAALI